MTRATVFTTGTYESNITRLLADMKWGVTLEERDDSDNLLYRGRNVEHDAATTDTDWYIWRFTLDSQNVTREQGPLEGAWGNRENLEWELLASAKPQEVIDGFETHALLGEVIDQLKITNIHLSLLSGETIKKEDL